jgi:hypothetical protein
LTELFPGTKSGCARIKILVLPSKSLGPVRGFEIAGDVAVHENGREHTNFFGAAEEDV